MLQRQAGGASRDGTVSTVCGLSQPALGRGGPGVSMVTRGVGSSGDRGVVPGAVWGCMMVTGYPAKMAVWSDLGQQFRAATGRFSPVRQLRGMGTERSGATQHLSAGMGRPSAAQHPYSAVTGHSGAAQHLGAGAPLPFTVVPPVAGAPPSPSVSPRAGALLRGAIA